MWLLLACVSTALVLVGIVDFFSTSKSRKFTVSELETEYGDRWEILQSRTGLLWFKAVEDRRWLELVCYKSTDDARKRIRQLQES